MVKDTAGINNSAVKSDVSIRLLMIKPLLAESDDFLKGELHCRLPMSGCSRSVADVNNSTCAISALDPSWLPTCSTLMLSRPCHIVLRPVLRLLFMHFTQEIDTQYVGQGRKPLSGPGKVPRHGLRPSMHLVHTIFKKRKGNIPDLKVTSMALHPA